jgi:hypothetical protein
LWPDLRRRCICLNNRGAPAAGEPRGARAHRSGISSHPTEPTAATDVHSVADLSSSRHGNSGSAGPAFLSTPEHRDFDPGSNRNTNRESHTYRNRYADGNRDSHLHAFPDSNCYINCFANPNGISYSNIHPHADGHRHSDRDRPSSNFNIHSDNWSVADGYLDLPPGSLGNLSAYRHLGSQLQSHRQ